MKNMKNRKKNFFQLVFPLDSGSTKGMAPVNFFFKKSFFPLSWKYLDRFGLICFHLGNFHWPHRFSWPYYITCYIHFLSQKFLIDAQTTFTWDPIWKISISNWRKSYHLTWLSTRLGLIWNPYLDRFHIAYVERFKTQHPIRFVLRILFAKQTSHENIKNIIAHYSKQFLFTAVFSKVSSR